MVKLTKTRAFSLIEYVVLVLIVLAAFLVLSNNIQRGIYGMWQQSGTSMAYGRQYDAQRTISCDYDDNSNLWYDHNCFLQGVATQCAIDNVDCDGQVIKSCSSLGNVGSACSEVTQNIVSQ